jgi:hypothetical protein
VCGSDLTTYKFVVESVRNKSPLDFLLLAADMRKRISTYMCQCPSGAVSWGTALQPEGRGFDSRRSRWNFPFTLSFWPHYGPGGYGLLWLCSPARTMASSFTRFLDHTQRCATIGRTPLYEWSARRRDLYLTTHNIHRQQTNIHAPGGIRTHDRSRRAAVDLHLRPRGHWVRQMHFWQFYDLLHRSTCFDTRASSLGSFSMPADLH